MSRPPLPSSQPARPEWSADRSSERVASLLVARDKLIPLHEKTGKPKPGEWLAEHQELGQTFEEYVTGKPTLPDAARHTIAVTTLGDFDPARGAILDEVATYLGLYFHLPVERAPALGLDLLPERARRVHPTWGDRQLKSSYILQQILKPRLPPNAAVLVAFTTSDLWPEDGWNFVFGEADLHTRVGVWSIYRFGDPSTGQAARELLLRRAVGVAVHETGHMFSLEHCTKYRCVQAGMNSLDESDAAPLWACPDCVCKIAYATGDDLAARYARLAAYWRERGATREVDFFEKSRAALG
ncbi:MAG: archaemetzincin [Polyangiaceae bacterium]